MKILGVGEKNAANVTKTLIFYENVTAIISCAGLEFQKNNLEITHVCYSYYKKIEI